MSWWWVDDEWMMNWWWADDELMMSGWWSDDERMKSRWWADDEWMMSGWWADDERITIACFRTLKSKSGRTDGWMDGYLWVGPFIEHLTVLRRREKSKQIEIEIETCEKEARRSWPTPIDTVSLLPRANTWFSLYFYIIQHFRFVSISKGLNME